ncbi:MAG: hypothetical protein ACXWZE_12340 [Candidatus Binatia bacterium]
MLIEAAIEVVAGTVEASPRNALVYLFLRNYWWIEAMKVMV